MPSLPVRTRREIEKLLRAGKLNQTEIAEQAGASESTVSLIANGKYHPPSRVYRKSDYATSGKDVRFCDKCGCDRPHPCVACAARTAAPVAGRQPELRHERTSVDLTDLDRVRYDAMRAERLGTNQPAVPVRLGGLANTCQ